MKIGIMLRHYNQHLGGVWEYTRNLLREMLALQTPYEFVLFYRAPKLVGTYGNKNVSARSLSRPRLRSSRIRWRCGKRPSGAARPPLQPQVFSSPCWCPAAQCLSVMGWTGMSCRGVRRGLTVSATAT